MSTIAYVCPDHGLIQRVLIPFGADDPVKFCAIEGCDAVVGGPVNVIAEAHVETWKRELRTAVADAMQDLDYDLGREDAESRALVAIESVGHPEKPANQLTDSRESDRA